MNILKPFVTLFAAIIMTLGGVAFAGSAEATRPIPGFKYTDQCKNIRGLQPSYMMVGTGPYRYLNKAQKTCYYARLGK